MNDTTFKQRLQELTAAKGRYFAKLQVCEDEYKRRFGSYPSDSDDDSWIDYAHFPGIRKTPSVAEITKGASVCRRIGSDSGPDSATLS